MKRPRWRKMTWFIVVVNVLFLIWLIAGAGAAAENCEGLVGEDLDICEAGTAVGATIGAGIIIFLWVLVDIILGILWLVTNRGRRVCPACGEDVKRGVTVCPNCGHDFAAAARAPAS
jgi:RNA polymerase subunit RPABC4/transcription elongation factor Spt4